MNQSSYSRLTECREKTSMFVSQYKLLQLLLRWWSPDGGAATERVVDGRDLLRSKGYVRCSKIK